MKERGMFLLPNKKGISDVIITLLIVLVALVSLGIVWAVVSTILQSSSLQTTSSFQQLLVNLKISSANLEADGTISVKVRRETGTGDLTGIKFIFYDGKNSETIQKALSLNELEEKTIVFTLSQIASSQAQTVSVAPVAKTGGTETTGYVTDTKVISKTPSGNAGGNNGGNIGGNNGGTGASCGNRICEPTLGETALTCPADCSTTGATCNNNGICDSSENSVSCPADCSSMNNQANTCGNGKLDAGEECDASVSGSVNCMPAGTGQCTCKPAYIQDSANPGSCALDTIMLSGTVGSIWPAAGAVKYFDSGDPLPQDDGVISYIGRYITFSSNTATETESRCIQITWAEYISDPSYSKSYLRLQPQTPPAVANIDTGYVYKIWHTQYCGVAP